MSLMVRLTSELFIVPFHFRLRPDLYGSVKCEHMEASFLSSQYIISRTFPVRKSHLGKTD